MWAGLQSHTHTHTYIYIYILWYTVKSQLLRMRLTVVRSSIMSWWRHQMETFSALLAICVGNSPVTGEFPAQRLVTRSFDVFFDLCLNKRLRKQWSGWWLETPLLPLWCCCNGSFFTLCTSYCRCANFGYIHRCLQNRRERDLVLSIG